MKNRLFVFLFAACLACSLCACGGGDMSANGGGNANPEATPSSQGAIEPKVTDSNEAEGTTEGSLPLPEEQTFPEYDGLIIERIYSRGNSNTGHHFTVDLTCLNIDTGTSQPVSVFEFDVGQINVRNGYIMPDSATLIGQVHNRSLFSEHYDKMALGKLSDTGIISAGWMDRNGNFFDVSGALGLKSENGIGFYAVGFCGDYFIFGEYGKNRDVRTNYRYVPVSDIREEKIVAINGIVDSPYFALGSKFGVGGNSINLTWVGQNFAFRDFNGEIVIVDENQITEFKPTNASCRNGIGSPDETQLAFLQMNENDIYEVYITEINNLSAIRKIEITDGTEYIFSAWTGSSIGTGGGVVVEGLAGCYLIDWE